MNLNSFSFFSRSALTLSTPSQGLISFLNTFDSPLEVLYDKSKHLALLNDDLLLEEDLIEDDLLLLSDPLLTGTLLLEDDLYLKLNLEGNLLGS